MKRSVITPARKRDRVARFLVAAWDRLTTSLAAAPEVLIVALAGYAVVGLFALVYGIVRSGWPELGQPSSIAVAGLAAAPLALALLWDRLGGIKAFGVEVTLIRASTQIQAELVGALTQELYGDHLSTVAEQINQAIVRPEQELLSVNLRNGQYWWSTRLFLLAALAEDYSRIQQLVFMEQEGARIFVGMASPGDVRQALATVCPILEQPYQAIKKELLRQPSVSQPSMMVTGMVTGWATTFERGGQPVSEETLRERERERERELIGPPSTDG